MPTSEEKLAELKAVDRPHTFIFTGHVYPERYQWTMQPPYELIVLHHDGKSSLLKISIAMSQVIATAHTNSAEDVLEMKNRVTRNVRNLADSLGFVAAAALDVEIISCIRPDGGHDVFNTAFEGLLDHEPDSPAPSRRPHHPREGPARQKAESALNNKRLPKINNWIRNSPITGSKTHLQSQDPDKMPTGAAARV